MSDLESRMIRDLKSGDYSVERSLLIASGLKTEEQVKSYERKLDILDEGFKQWYFAKHGEFLEKAKFFEEKNKGLEEEKFEDLTLKQLISFTKGETLHDYLWKDKKNRYYDGEYLLSEVIDNQLSEDENQRVGNCIGLTQLYTVLGLRNNLDVSILSDTNHVLTVLHSDNEKEAIENTFENGYGFLRHDLTVAIKKFSGKEDYDKSILPLIFNIYVRSGNTKSEKNDFTGAISDFDKAIELEPDEAPILVGRAHAKSNLEDYAGSLIDHNRAIELEPNIAHYFLNRAVVKAMLGDLNGGIMDCNTNIELESDNATCLFVRSKLKQQLGNHEGAKKDFDKHKTLLGEDETK